MKLTTPDTNDRPFAGADKAGAKRVEVALINSNETALATLERDLQRRGFDVTRLARAKTVVEHLICAAPDVALFDIRTPNQDTYDMFLRLRDQSDIPVVLLTDSTDEVEEIIGLRMGADAVLRKPCSPQLLAERIRALSRRTRIAASATQQGDAKMDRPPLSMDADRMATTWRGTALDLTATEFKLLHALAERPGFVRTRDFLMDRLYGTEIYVLDRTVDSHVKRLRKKLRDIDPGFDAIETLYGTGYRLNLPDTQADDVVTQMPQDMRRDMARRRA